MTFPGRSPVVVVGGTGFVGSHVSERLAAGGAAVRAASRRGRWPWGNTPSGIDCVSLDLTAPAAGPRLRELAAGAAAVVHLAGILYRPGLPGRAYRDLHVEGTRRVVAAARAAGVRRLVHVSTTGVLGPTGPRPLHEDAPPRPTTPYEASKLEGERIVLAAREAGGPEVVVLRPGLVYGPRDLHLLPLYRSISRGWFRPIAGGRARWQPIHVGDVARAVAAAVDVEPGPEAAVLHVAGGETVTVGALVRRIASALGTRLRGPALPYAVAMAAGTLIELGCRPLGIDPPLSRSRVRTLTEDRLYDTGRAARALGFVPRTALDDGLAETVAWYREHGYL